MPKKKQPKKKQPSVGGPHGSYLTRKEAQKARLDKALGKKKPSQKKKK